MQNIRVKSFSESLEYDYSVCEIIDCKQKSWRLAMTETRFVDFCEDHYRIYILGEE
jgi:hypothetical protein